MRPRTALVLLASLLSACGVSVPPARDGSAAPGKKPTAPAGTRWTGELVGRLPGAVDLAYRDPADGWFYVVSRNGTIERWAPDGTRLSTVLDISSSTTGEGERGLLGLTVSFWAGTPRAWINYTDLNGDTVVSWFAIHDDGSFDTSTRALGTTVLTIPQPHSNHNGGAMATGPDQAVYVGTGDGGSAGDPERRALDPDSLLGKILRIDPGTGRAEVWSRGLRNPWRISFDSSGNLWVADVGQDKWEEVSVATAVGGVPGGRDVNFGWSAWEGSHRYNRDQDPGDALMPVHEYEHGSAGCSISGGVFVDFAEQFPPGSSAVTLEGSYVFGDYCSGEVRAVTVANGKTAGTRRILEDVGNITAVRRYAQDVYVLTLDGDVRRIVPG